MDNTNIGIVNHIITSNLKTRYLDENNTSRNKIGVDVVLDAIKNSKILQLEFKIYNNLENKYIKDDLLASRYIDSNISLLEVYSLEEILEERKKLNEFNSLNIKDIPKEILKLYYNINTLISESLKNSDKVNVDSLHESFTYVLNHIKTPKNNDIVVNEDINYSDRVIEIAIDKFNEKYTSLTEDEKILFKTLTTSTYDEKISIFESYKTDILTILNKTESVNIKESIEKAKNKINEMKIDLDSIDMNIISLFEFKNQL